MCVGGYSEIIMIITNITIIIIMNIFKLRFNSIFPI